MSATASPAPGAVLVATKLHVPAVRAGAVSRRELIERLSGRGGGKLVLLCAPAGWGKTTLVSEWCASEQEGRRFAWVSLDASDSDPVRFWSYLIAALRTVEPGLGASSLAALPAAGPALVDAVVAPLINDLTRLERPLVLVLDDYHLVRDEAVHDSVAFLLRHLPPYLELAIASRADPPLPLGGLRVAGEVLEIRAAELRFSEAEADALLNGSLGLGFEPSDVSLLQKRTEGWAAGLQLAALSARAREDRHAFVLELAGDDRQIGDYLHEVLASQPAGLRRFLLRTSILERMCADLCDAVTGDGGSALQLDVVERSNLFLVPLDERREWYRYHHLFRDLLRHELERAQPGLALQLHRRASAWYRRQGHSEEAIAHATYAGEYGDAADLISRHWRPVFNTGQAETVARWIARLPRDEVLADVRLCLAQGSLMLYLGRLDEAANWLRHADGAQLRGRLDEGISSAEGDVALLRASHAYLSGDVAQAIEASRRAVSLHPDETDTGRAIANITLGLNLYYAGEASAAVAPLEEALARLSRDGWSFPIEGALAGLALTYADARDPARAERVATEAERLIGEAGLESPGAVLTLARGKLLELQGDLPGADAAFARAAVLARRGSRRLVLAHALLLLARLKRRRRDHGAARALAREARVVLDTCPDPGILGGLLTRTERTLQLRASHAAAPVPADFELSERALQLTSAPRATAEQLPADVELSERELTVLRLLASELSQREIGSELYVSFNTVKAHTRSIFRKLGASNRAEAVARGRELGLD